MRGRGFLAGGGSLRNVATGTNLPRSMIREASREAG